MQNQIPNFIQESTAKKKNLAFEESLFNAEKQRKRISKMTWKMTIY
jgi:hypothetical protein